MSHITYFGALVDEEDGMANYWTWWPDHNRYTELSNLVIQNCQSPPEIGQLERMIGLFGRLANW